ncbi:MAG: DUF1211 domain-containing protein [Methanogenium sp.]|nr:DUF1211 domain-containing protein [Methanogenium sp.]
MVSSPEQAQGYILSKHRIEGLTDGIFAIAMTIAVLNISVDQLLSGAGPVNYHTAFSLFWPQIFHYAITFVILAMFWIGLHGMFHNIRHVDNTFIWLNMCSLFFICLMPFSTAVIGDFPDSPAAIIFYAFNLFMIGIIYYRIVCHASKDKRLLVPEVRSELIERSKRRTLIIPVVSVCVSAAAFVIPEFATTLFLLIWVGHLWIERTRSDLS